MHIPAHLADSLLNKAIAINTVGQNEPPKCIDTNIANEYLRCNQYPKEEGPFLMTSWYSFTKDQPQLNTPYIKCNLKLIPILNKLNAWRGSMALVDQPHTSG